MYNNIDYLLKRLNPAQKRALIHIIQKLDSNQPLTFYDDVGLTGCWEWIPKTFLLAVYQHEYSNQEIMKKAIDKYKIDENGMVHFPTVIHEFIKLSIERDRPATLLDFE